MRSLFATVAASTLSANQRRDCSNLLQCWQTVVARTHPLKRLTFCGGDGGRAERKKLLRFTVGGNTPRSEMGTLAPSGSGPTAVTQLESLSEDRQSVLLLRAPLLFCNPASPTGRRPRQTWVTAEPQPGPRVIGDDMTHKEKSSVATC